MAKNSILKIHEKLINKENQLRKKENEQLRIASDSIEKAKQINLERRNNHYILCKAISEEIIASDLNLDEIEMKFLTMLIFQKKNPKITLLEDLIRRKRHKFYPPMDEAKILSKKYVYNIIGYNSNLFIFFQNLNKKLKGIIQIKVYKHFNFNRKEIQEDKLAINIEFES